MSPLAAALDLIDRGINPVPVAFRSKKPSLGDEWQHVVIDATMAPKYFNGGQQNVGMQLGPRSHGLTDVDLDCLEAVEIGPKLLPKTEAIFGRKSMPGSHRLYMTNLASTINQAALQFRDPTNGKMLLELRIGGGGKGAQTVGPGSMHESGEPIEWSQNGEPAQVDDDELVRATKLIAACSLLARHWPHKGGRHDIGLVLGGFLRRAGLEIKQILQLVELIARAAHDEEWKDRVKAAQDHARHHDETERGFGLPALVEAVGERVATKIAEWLDYATSDRTAAHTNEFASIVTVRACEVKMRPKQWLWEGHLLRGALELLTGQPGLGKSQVQIHFIACVTAGVPWPDGAAAIAPCNVILVTAEDAIDTEVVPRLAGAGADLTRVHIVKNIKTDKYHRQFLLTEDLVRLEQLITQIGNVGLVCIDPITAYMGGKIDAHKTTEVRSQLGPLKDFSESTNLAVSAITHPAKNASAKAIDHFIGSQAFIAAARIGHACFEEIEVDKDTGDKMPTGRMLFTNVKYNAHRKMPTLAYTIEDKVIVPEPFQQIETTYVVWAKEAVNISAEQAIAATRRGAKTRVQEEAADEVIDFLRTMIRTGDGWCAQSEIAAQAKALGISDKELRTARKKLAIISKKKDFDGVWLWGLEGKRPIRF